MSRLPGISDHADLGYVGAWAPLGRASLLLLNDIKEGFIRKEYDLSAPSWSGDPRFVFVPRSGIALTSFGIPEDGSEIPAVTSCRFHELPPAREDEPEAARAEEAIEDAEERKERQEGVRRQAREEDEGKEEQPPVVMAREPSWGPRPVDIIPHLDREQVETVAFPRDGALVISGPPGTGKTMVALYRIQFLLEAQREASSADPGGERYFRQDRILYLVGKEHLVPYVRELAWTLHVQGIQVMTFRDWFRKNILQPYFGGRATHARVPAPVRRDAIAGLFPVRSITAWAQERRREELIQFVERVRAFANEVIERVHSWIGRDQWSEGLYFAPLERAMEIGPTEKAAEGSLAILSEHLGTIRKDLVPDRSNRRPVLDELRRKLGILRSSLRPDYEEIVRSYYETDEALHWIAKSLGSTRAEKVRKWLADRSRPLDSVDHVTCGWVVEAITSGVASDHTVIRPLERWDHLVLDEAQYYSPQLVALLCRLARRPRRAVTIVGDPAQAVDSSLSQVPLGERVPGDMPKKVVSLGRLYRCSREIYGFLRELRDAIGLEVAVEAPREMDSFSGAEPEVRILEDARREFRWILDKILEIRDAHPEATIAVIHPRAKGPDNPYVGQLRAFLEEHVKVATRSWKPREDREETAEVVLARPSDVVGLEFDAVFLCDLGRSWTGSNAKYAIWTAATRARHHLYLVTRPPAPPWLRDLMP